MPTESALAAEQSSARPAVYTDSPPLPIKCSLCGMGALSLNDRDTDGVVILSDPIERICGGCVRAQNRRGRQRSDSPSEAASSGSATSLVTWPANDWQPVEEATTQEESRGREQTVVSTPREERAVPISTTPRTEPPTLLAQSLPTRTVRPWTTASKVSSSAKESMPESIPEGVAKKDQQENDSPFNPLVDIHTSRCPNIGRGALYPGSIFRGTQTSGRSAYEVEIKILAVNFPESTVSGYLSISHLTDAHPHLTTFFDGEIVGPKYGFITGARYGATEHDDMRHWGRFEQFRRPATRVDMVRPELFLRDPVPDRSRGETKAKERDFVFLRIKEKFLVPDHTVRDISGASFAGFYFAMIDLAPKHNEYDAFTSNSSASPKTPLSPTGPVINRRGSSTDARPSGRPGLERRRRSSQRNEMAAHQPEPTLRGYYFHSLNQEPFQELFLTHVPCRSSSTMELR